MFALILIFFSLAYFGFILWFIIGFEKFKTLNYQEEKATTNFSILIPFRNEEDNLPMLLNSITKLNYPKSKFEIIFIDDDSQDNSKVEIEKWQTNNPEIKVSIINNVRFTNSPKKDALTLAISKSKFNWIVTTDADCILPKNWLAMFNKAILNQNPLFIAAPVKFKTENSFLFHFQNFNFLALMGSTIGAFGIKKPFLCNGANLCYSKEIFTSLNGFDGNSKIASGDDVFLLKKMVKNYPERTIYLKWKESIVETKSENNWTSFFQQQLRWASKTSAYTNVFSKSIGIVVFFQNLLLILIGIWSIIEVKYFQYFIILFTLKLLLDFTLIKKTAHFLDSKANCTNYFLSSILYPFFVVIVALSSTIKNYQWKGRTFNS